MTPQNTRVWRKDARRARRGVRTGRRATHAVETTYGRHQKDAARRARWAEFDHLRGRCFHKAGESCQHEMGDAA
jgi:hypothetical protein